MPADETGTAVERRKPQTIEQWLEKAGPAMARALPNVGISGERYLQLTMIAVKNSDRLMKCTPVSVAVAAVQAAATGLIPNSPLGHASLIPRSAWKDGARVQVCNFQIEYKGWLQLVQRTDEVEPPSWRVVYGNEPFKFRPAARADKIEHEIIEDPALRGGIRGAYFSMYFRRGGQYALYMPLADILAIRDRYSDGWKAFKAGRAKDTPWNPDNPVTFPWMLMKTVIIQATKRAPLTTELGHIVAAAAARQEVADQGKLRQLAAEFFDDVEAEDVRFDDEPYTVPVEAPASGATDDAGAELAEFQAAVNEWPRDARSTWERAHDGKAACVGPSCTICRWPAQPPHAFEPAKRDGKSCKHDGMGPLWHRRFAPREGGKR